ncbi:hypothetical protein [Acidithiobacillus sulfuriphilus]|uniref:Uncharacterized protein n=1 Tax=Acidithiobacillus sulfuriphilus TaxID=1867749 RepID=A0ACD5HRK9_9PROT|nr:hypothetical protein [Acidithiobacillus sulfuriphilus]
MELTIAVFLGVDLVVLYGLSALGVVLLVFGPQKADDKCLAAKTAKAPGVLD